MAYSDNTEFPRGIYRNTGAAARTVTTNQIKVSSIAVTNNGAAADILTFTDGAGAIVYTIAAPLKTTVVCPGFQSLGLKTLISVATMEFTVFYFNN